MSYDAAAIRLKGAEAKTNFRYKDQATKLVKGSLGMVQERVRWELLQIKDKAAVRDLAASPPQLPCCALLV